MTKLLRVRAELVDNKTSISDTRLLHNTNELSSVSVDNTS